MKGGFSKVKTIEKRFPADTTLDITTFLNDKKVDGELYALLQGLSKHEGYETYVLKKDLPKQAIICETIGVKSPKTLRVHLKYLIDQKLVEEQDDRYVLPLQENIYFLIPLKTLQFLMDNCREHVIKTYIYLGQRWKWARANNIQCVFSFKDLIQHIGITGSHENIADRKIKNALEILQQGNLINYERTKQGWILTYFDLKLEEEIIEDKTLFPITEINQSTGEKIISNILNAINISYQTEKTFPSCIFPDSGYPARFDFWVSNKYIIEYDGEQHFSPIQVFGGEEQCNKTKQHDNFKNQWCKENNIPLIRIPYTHLNEICVNDLKLETSKFIVKI